MLKLKVIFFFYFVFYFLNHYVLRMNKLYILIFVSNLFSYVSPGFNGTDYRNVKNITLQKMLMFQTRIHVLLLPQYQFVCE